MKESTVLPINKLHINYKAREWCELPYPDHPFGCPNIGNKSACPPQAPLVEEFFNLSKPLYIAVIKFDLANQIRRMKILNPGWSDRQARCVLYWQKGVNGCLDMTARQFCYGHENLIHTICPEAMGVNVITTALDVGVPIKVKPVDTIYKVALIGESK